MRDGRTEGDDENFARYLLMYRFPCSNTSPTTLCTTPHLGTEGSVAKCICSPTPEHLCLSSDVMYTYESLREHDTPQSAGNSAILDLGEYPEGR